MKLILFLLAFILLASARTGNYYLLSQPTAPFHHFEYSFELGDQVLVYSEERLDEKALIDIPVEVEPSLIFINKLKLCGADIQEFYHNVAHTDEFAVLFKGFSYIIYQAKDLPTFEKLIKASVRDHVKLMIPEGKKITLLKTLTPQPTNRINDYINKLISNIDSAKLFNTVQQLARYNRYSLGTNFVEAQKFITAQVQLLIQDGAQLEISAEPFTVSKTSLTNIIVTLKGKTDLDKWYIVGAHLDSTSQSPTTSAPGAEDNASGSAGVLEMLRAFAKYPPERGTFFFIWYAGEEQGLYGSAANANAIVSRGDKSKVISAFTHDMIGYKKSNFGVIIETAKSNQTFYQDIYQKAVAYVPTLALRIDTNPFGSDHVSYLNKGIPSTLAIDQDWGSYPYYHRTTDIPDAIDTTILTTITKLEVAAIVIASGN